MIRRAYPCRVLLLASLWLLSGLGVGCGDDTKAAVDGGRDGDPDSGVVVDSGKPDEKDASRPGQDAATGGVDDAGGDGGVAADGGDANVSEPDITGPASFHIEYKAVSGSNVNANDFDSDAPTGNSVLAQTLRGTTLSASRSIAAVGEMHTVKLFLSGDLEVGASFDIVQDPVDATDGKAYVELVQNQLIAPFNVNTWRAESGTLTIDAFDGDSIVVSSTDLPMIVSTINSPGNDATGTFKATLQTTVLAISGL
jgi:hypothetical protein